MNIPYGTGSRLPCDVRKAACYDAGQARVMRDTARRQGKVLAYDSITVLRLIHNNCVSK